MRRLLAAAVTVLMLSCTGDEVVTQYRSLDDVRTALAYGDIGCTDVEPYEEAVACSFDESIPQENGFGVVIIFADASDAAFNAEHCSSGVVGLGSGQIIYRDGQSWLGAIAATTESPDAIDVSRIEDQAFVDKVAELLRSEVAEC
jgi:hypothetical protein